MFFNIFKHLFRHIALYIMKKAHQIVNNNLLPFFDFSTKYFNRSQTKSIKNMKKIFLTLYLDNNLKGNITRGRRKSHSAQFLVITVNYLLV